MLSLNDISGFSTKGLISLSASAFVVLVFFAFIVILIKQKINMDSLSNINNYTFLIFITSLSVTLGTLVSYWIDLSIFTCFKILALTLPIVGLSGVRSFKG
ncbi:hypothetical protein P9112_005317 [Eukaryota sp. TZLM1-RC]